MTTRWTPTGNPALLDGSNRNANRTGHFPDFHEPAGGGTLVRLVLESIQDISGPHSSAKCCGTSANGLPSTILLRLLTYSYAAGVYGSEEIEAELHRDQTLRYLTTEYRPRFDDFRQFRRRCRSELRLCLAEVLRRASECGIEIPATGDREDFNLEFLESNGSGLLAAGIATRFEIEADARIAHAVLADCSALDE